jgi:Spy/CpxP family protein refolding chaperone
MRTLKKALFCCAWLYVFSAISLVRADNAATANSAPEAWKHGEEKIQEIFNQLNLTEAQKKQLEANKIQLRAKMKSARALMKADRELFQQELMKPQLDMNKVNELHRRIKALESQMADDRLTSILVVRTILTPQQFSAFVGLMHQHKPEHAGPPEHEDHE